MEKEELNRGFGLWSSLALVIGTIIGSGIFFKQGAILQTAGSTSMALLAWLAGGVLTLTAGMTVAEVGSQMTETGGLYLYLTKLYGKTIGFLSGWMQVVFYGPAMMGAIASYFGLLFTALFNLPKMWSIPVGMVGLGLIGLLNSLPNKNSAFFQVLTTTIKLLPIVGLTIFGLFFGQNDALGQTVHTVSSHGGGFGVAVLATLFAYDGWVTLANISGEIKNPQKTLPKAIVYGLLVVIVAYVGVSYGTFSSLGANQIVAYGEQATVHVAEAAFGLFGGRLLSLAVLVSLLGTLNGKVLSFPRVLYAMAQQGEFPFAKTFAKLHASSKTPNAAIWLMIGIGYLMMWVTDPNQLTDYAVFITFLFYILAFIGAFILRRRDPKGEKRDFSMPLYPVIPIIAILGSLYVEVSELMNDLHGVLISVIIVLLGLPVYYWLNNRK
ncbi:APC family permease [Fructobacillus sp. M1-13]|uniref:APC family permease n=1 Tax=Fructobacillus papyriferae TaxID=2713171 RepID=A0ABS5QQF8_9LACO|nr:APC family permease [Fructobacillus papyriferae]MBS9335409.1 APC family permease [Fructobacillus papyriferae]MCD2158921.1 APC family permease [Fructobacillus papyriferae]